MKSKFLLLASLLAGFTAVAAENIAVVNDNRVNVRGQAKLNSEVITQLKKGEKVTILEEIAVEKPKKGEPAKWYRIALPANTPVWVNANFVKDNAVSSPKLNVRSGPGENFSIIARLEKGAAVKEIRTVGDWKEIEAPAGSSAYVASDLLQRQEMSSSSGVLAEKKPAAPAPATAAAPKAKQVAKAAPAPVTPPPVTTPAPVVPAAPLETVKADAPPAPVTANPEVKPAGKRAPKAAPKPAEVAAATPAPAAPAPERSRPIATEPVVTPVTPAVEPAPEKKGFFSRVFGKSSKTNATETAKAPEKTKPAKASASKAKAAPAPEVSNEPLPVRIVTREGIVRRSFNIQTPSYYALESTDTGKIVNYLYSSNTNLPWAALKDRTVSVTGQEAIDKRWPNTPVLTIETLNTLP
jgi:uncharacterized protein YgiM (DUF1202 family)